MGTTELIVVGVLNLIADDLAVSISTAGQLVAAYALGISIGAPILTALTSRVDRRFLLRLSLAAFVAGNILAVAAVGFDMLVVARVLTGSLHGLFIAVAFVAAAALVPADRQGSAMSIVIGGIAVSTVVGVPLGTLIGQVLGWRAAFIAIVILGAGALVSTLTFVPNITGRGRGGFGAQARAALAPRVLAMLAVGLLLLGGQFTALTYLAPYLAEVTGISGGVLSGFLLAFGVATAAGSFLGGRAADRSPATALIAANGLLVLALGALYLVGSSPVLVVVALTAWGLVGFGLVPALQVRVISLAGSGGDLGATLGVSAVNAGIAGGSLIGGWALATGGVDAAVVVAAAICALALPATWATRFLKVPAPVSDNAAAAVALAE
ncbi:MAG: MFS transporter [Actinomycetota bacterium]|nr:MFS transporter [Actinomycetota bacterium]